MRQKKLGIVDVFCFLECQSNIRICTGKYVRIKYSYYIIFVWSRTCEAKRLINVTSHNQQVYYSHTCSGLDYFSFENRIYSRICILFFCRDVGKLRKINYFCNNIIYIFHFSLK